MNDKRKKYSDQEKSPKRNHPKQLHSDNVFTNDLENPKCTNERRNYFSFDSGVKVKESEKLDKY